jgi:hypothetical protein
MPYAGLSDKKLTMAAGERLVDIEAVAGGLNGRGKGL